jgi:hypothetical protein
MEDGKLELAESLETSISILGHMVIYTSFL